MLNNHFSNAPTVGSHDQIPTIERLQSQLQQADQRVNELEKRLATAEERRIKEDQTQKGFRWKKFFKKVTKKVSKFFSSIIPLIDTVCKVLNTVCRYKEAVAK